MRPLTADAAHAPARDEVILNALSLLVEPGSTVEMRIPKTGEWGTITAYYTDMHRLAVDAAGWSGKVPGIYFTLNPVRPELLARANNRVRKFTPRGEGTEDGDILRRRWLPVDFDPRRPEGISATDAEHQAAIDRAVDCCDWLRIQGYSDPILADSGNGAHLLYRIDLPNDAASLDMVKRCLEAIAAKFSDDVVMVDTSTCNAARVWKLYGTAACKGDPIPGRPHRQARILEVPK